MHLCRRDYQAQEAGEMKKTKPDDSILNTGDFRRRMNDGMQMQPEDVSQVQTHHYQRRQRRNRDKHKKSRTVNLKSPVEDFAQIHGP
jgi:hypothetical protein